MAQRAATRTRECGEANGALPAPRLFNEDEYQRMGEAGILGEDDRVELWEGTVIEMPPIGHDHAGSTGDFNTWLAYRLFERAIVWMQNPVRLSASYEPQPDILVLRLRPDRYRDSLPGPEDVLLLIEVSHTTLRYDRNVKLPQYAQAGIPEVWIADLKGKRLLVYRNPRDGTYTEQLVLGSEDSVAPMAFPDVTISIAAVLV